MLKKEINNIELSIETPYEIQLVNIPAGIYRLRIIHQSRAVFDRPRSLFFTFDIPGLTPQEIRDLLGLKDISAQNGVFAYAGGGEEKAGFYVQEVELNVTQELSLLTLGIKTFLENNNLLVDSIFIHKMVKPLQQLKDEFKVTSYEESNDQLSLYLDNDIVVYQFPQNVFLIKEEKYTFEADINEEAVVYLFVECLTSKSNKKGVVANITFYNKFDNIINKPYQGMNSSKLFDSYFYIYADTNNIVRKYPISVPSGAFRIKVELVNFLVAEGVRFSCNSKLVIDQTSQKKNEGYYLKNFEKIIDDAKKIPDSNGSRFYEKLKIKVGVVGDVLTYEVYKDIFEEAYYLGDHNYKDFLYKDLDLIVYARKADDKKEFNENIETALNYIVELSNDQGIKTVYQSPENKIPDYLLPIVKKIDYVLVFNEDHIEAYREKLEHNNVFYIDYGIHPLFNNPIGSRRNIRNAVLFSESYLQDRSALDTDINTIFDSILDISDELYIADENHFKKLKNIIDYNKFQHYSVPPITEQSQLQKVQKLFRYNLHFTFDKSSSLELKRIIYNWQAQGLGIISNYSKAIFNNFPEIRVIPYKQDMSFDFEDISLEEYKNQIDSLRLVYNLKTSYQIVGELIEKLGLNVVKNSNKYVAIICDSKNDLILDSFNKQNYPYKILIESKDLRNWKTIRDKYNVFYFSWFDENNLYEDNYIADLINGFKYTDSDYITKNSYFDSRGNWIKGKEHEYTDYLLGKELTVFSCKNFQPIDFIDYGYSEKIFLPNGYSIDPFELNYIIYLKSNNLKKRPYTLSVIVPIFNNGDFLLKKCIPSLKRNKIWNDMEVLLIDDGSTDNVTLETINRLTSQYSNVYAYFYPSGGSGSASRARNKGIENSTASLLTFLDPDNEISPGGYDQLVNLYYEASEKGSLPVDFISGYHVKISDSITVIGKHSNRKLRMFLSFRKHFFDKGKFPVIATQPAVITKEFIKRAELKFVESAVGQDTLFGWEVLINASRGGFTDRAYLLYYADRQGSVTNTVDLDYFKKKLILEKAQVSFLKENKLLDLYINNHFEHFLKNWYLKKLQQVDISLKSEVEKILNQICKLYSDNIQVINGSIENRHDKRNLSLTEEIEIYQSYISKYQNNKITLDLNQNSKVVFILHSSLPYLSGGYATRAHGLIKGIKKSGIEVYPYTRPGFPNDLKRKNLQKAFPIIDEIDGINYRRMSSEINRLENHEKVYMLKTIKKYKEIFEKEEPAIVHGRSTYLISLPAYIAALSLGIPFVYEVSGLWELVFESRSDASENLEKIERIRALETLVMRGADQILTLTSDMKDEIISRGVPEDKITLVPNSVDTNQFLKVNKDLNLQKSLNLSDDQFVFGYIGSFVEYEGLDDLIYAFNKVALDMPKAKLLLVGSGNVKSKIVELAITSPYSDRIIILDRVPHEEVINYYSLLDVVVFARKGWDVCERVSPMKPFEAMACEKVVLASSVKALRDIVNDGVTGFIFNKDSIEDLSLHLVKLYSQKEILPEVGKMARDWVVKNRSWEKAGKGVVDLYSSIIFSS